MPDLLTLAVLAAAAARLTRLAVVDDIAAPARVAGWRAASALGGARAAGWYESLVTCPHCIGFWITAATVGVWWLWGHVPAVTYALVTLALAYVVGHVCGALGETGNP